jgi:Spy/CpxP family protein refolding chaperone
MNPLPGSRRTTLAIGWIGMALLVTGGTWTWVRVRPVPMPERRARLSVPDDTGSSGEPGSGGRRGDFRRWMLERLTEELNLTARQRTQIATLQENLRSDQPIESVSQEDWWKQRQKRREALNAAIRTVLTPEQNKKFTAMQQQMRGPGGPGGGPPPGMGRPGMGGPGMNRPGMPAR